MKSIDTALRWRRAGGAALAGALTVGLLASMTGPAVAQDAAAAPESGPAQAASYTEQVLARNGDNAIDPVLGRYYRIPALADLGEGVLLASYDGRPDGADAPSANSILQRRSTDGGKTWGAPTYIARGQVGGNGQLKYGFSDPSYVVDRETGAIFNFHVYSKDVSFQGSAFGNDDADRQITSAQVSVSTDKGVTWSSDPANMPVLPPSGYDAGSGYAGFAGPLITDVVKPEGETVGSIPNVGGVAGVFAASGEGIQLRYGAHKGRLIQQFTGKVKQADGSTAYQAYSVFSDDHGKTWQRGAFTGTGMDENKTVELSNGDVMLNSRTSSGERARKVAISQDGGASYGPVTVNTALVDPVNNAAITRMYPDAAQGSAAAKMLLFSNANSNAGRVNGTIRYSCDDGASWSPGKQFKAGAMSYSTVSALTDGTFGVFYEGENNTMTFGKFNAEWLGVYCGARVAAAPVTGANGTTVPARVTVTNTGASALENASVTFSAKTGWTFGAAPVPEIAPGSSTTVEVPVIIPAFAKAGAVDVTAVLTVDKNSVLAGTTVTITGGATENIVGLEILGSRTDSDRDLATDPYAAGEAVPYQFAVNSLGNIASNALPVSGNFAPLVPAGPGNCRYNNLPVWSGYVCSTPRHAVTAQELASGYFVPLTTWEVTGTGAPAQAYTITGDEVDLLVRKPALAGAATVTWNDVDGNALAGPGDTVTTTVTVTNAGNVTLTDVAAAGVGSPAASLAAGETTAFTTTRNATAAELSAGQVRASGVTATGHNGTKAAVVELSAAALELPVVTAKPTGEPSVDGARVKGQPPVDLKLGSGKYSVGDTVTVGNAPANQWAYVYLAKHGQRIGWYLADANGTITFTLPRGTKNGKDTLVLLDRDGTQLSFGALHVTPRA
ncbi:exo-alpha-sialidase [Specibacter sp. RAF43]|uniref:exo-alpha-sialidase n=1 Tax=Specibacter sp. RAF43 TaxID=3233057 RepID=UPI003F9CCC73